MALLKPDRYIQKLKAYVVPGQLTVYLNPYPPVRVVVLPLYEKSELGPNVHREVDIVDRPIVMTMGGNVT